LTNLNDNQITIKSIKTKGDQIQNVRLSEFGGKGLFSSNIEKELKEKKIDIAVHALKDMPAIETEGLKTDTFLERSDPREILITNNKKKLNELQTNSIVGTSSFRREFQIKRIRSDVNCKIIRGNIDTRIRKLNEGLYDAIILSYAGIQHLKLDDEIVEIYSTQKIIPSAGQGIIALQSRNDDKEISPILEKVNHIKTYYQAKAERNVLKILEGDCETAVGVYAFIEGEELTLRAELFSIDGAQRYYEKKKSNIKNSKEAGKELGEILKERSKKSYKK
jgi:hydroxymethylbilane synthase